MKYPSLSELSTSRELIDVFKGYNHNLRIGDGEFYDMQNLTSADYPVLSPRSQRGVFLAEGNPQGMIAKDSLCYVVGDTLYINGYPVPDRENEKFTLYTECNTCPLQGTCLKFKENSTYCEKTMISMGAYIIIMPDKKYINTANLKEFGDIEAKFEASSAKFTLCKVDGMDYEVPENQIGATPPDNPDEEAIFWIDTSSTPHVLKQYAPSSKSWVSVATTYLKISATGIGKLFDVEDGVYIDLGEDEKVDAAIADFHKAYMYIYDKGDDYIVVKGILDKVITHTTGITVSRRMPHMDFIIESENRLWGCRYGPALNGQIVNEIYASRLGDFKNWNSFASISTDSYVATVGTDGQFTGAITHLGYPLFFKENYIHKIYGNYPANFQIQTTACRGVQKGSSKSLAIVNETLYYKSASGICAYDGSLPVEMSSALGDVQYEDAVSGVLGNKFYISMFDTTAINADKQYPLFVYDTRKGLWHKEDNTKVSEFCNCRGELYFIDSDRQIKTVRGTGEKDTSMVKWMAETGILGTDSPDKKYISRIDIRLSLSVGSRVYIYAQYDSIDAWEQIFAASGTTLKTFSAPVKPKRCDHLRLRIVGEGEAKIFSICKTIEQGSDI